MGRESENQTERLKQPLFDVSAAIETARISQAQNLDLSAQELTELPESIGELTHLRQLVLSSNRLSKLPESISQLVQLKQLILNNNPLVELPESIGELTGLLQLSLSNNMLTVLPRSIGRLKHLQQLSVNNNPLTQLPESIGELNELRELVIGSTQISEIPESIGGLTHLRRLIINNNPLTQLPESIGELTQLRFLNVYRNQIAKLPESIGGLTHLRHLIINNNPLTQLPESIGELNELRELVIGFTQISKLPASIGQLTQLQHLNVSQNQITELPESIGNLTQLQHLNVSNNHLIQLPDSIGQMAQLERLFLRSNKLRQLPESIGQLSRLSILFLVNNQLTTLPQTLTNLNNLTTLYLHSNQALELPAEILGPSWQDNKKQGRRSNKPKVILEYFFRVQGGKRPLNEAKLILLGRGGVGKTSLVNRLVDDKYESDEKKTEGIKITEWGFQLERNENVRLNIWDFGGQEIMHATHQFFLTQRSLYLVVLNGREGGEDADAEYWLKLIESFGGESPVILVLNKITENPFDVNRRALQRKYPLIRDFIKTDCKDKTGLRQLYKAIRRETDRLEHLRDAFPAKWFVIKDQLAVMKKNYLSFEEYRKVCAELGETDYSAQESLAFYLHSLGIALNYKDDPRLQDTHVLNPHWVTNGIYKILNSSILEKNKGDIRLNDLSKILDPYEYPTSMRRFIIDLMKKFDLCFSFPGDDTHYLIPELLDKQEPTEAALFNPEDCLNFQYHYFVLPEGLLPRLIVRTHVLSEGLPRWRTGVILKFEDNRALIKADVQDKKIFISVLGQTQGRRRLLAIIRSDFERIHHDIRNLQPAEMVPLPRYPNVVMSYEELLVMEQNRMATFPKVVGNRVVNLNVSELLNGVDLEGTRNKEQILSAQGQRIRLFYSYSHKDETMRNQLETHLKLLQRQGLIEMWHDRKIEVGTDWKHQIDINLERAHIILLLISADFIASDYCYDKEMKRALERHENGEAKVIPIILREVSWARAPFAKLQALPANGLPVTVWSDKDSAWRNVSEGLERLIEEMRESPPLLE